MREVRPNYQYWQSAGAYWVEEYEQRRREIPYFLLQELAWLSIFAPEAPASVLEFGCGVGRHLKYLREIEGIDVHGCDQSETMLEGCRRWAEPGWADAHLALVQPTGRLPYKDKSIDFVYSCEVLIHTHPDDLQGRIQEMVRVARKAVIHMEPSPTFGVHRDAHEGCWNHDLPAAYSRLGVEAKYLGDFCHAQGITVHSIQKGWLPKCGPDFLLRLRLLEELANEQRVRALNEFKDNFASIENARGERPRKMSPRTSAELSAAQIQARASAFLDKLQPSVRADVETKIKELGWHQEAGLLSPQMYVGKRVLDWESGMGGFAAAFYCLGAAEICAIDSWVSPESICDEFRELSNVSFAQISISKFREIAAASGDKFDLVFANTVTEHISDLPSAFDAIYELLEDGGKFLNNHDNYYSPCGSHDHGFWFYGQEGRIDYLGTKCWESALRCDASAEHRRFLRSKLPWTWDSDLDAKCDPADCSKCAYFKRSQPWAHLRFVDEFREVFPDSSFLTMRPTSSLNKFTTFQVRELLNEGGFQVVKFARHTCANTADPDLVASGFSELELRTTTTLWLCARAGGAVGPISRSPLLDWATNG